MRQRIVTHARRLVVKIGTTLISSSVGGMDFAFASDIAAQVAALRSRGIEVVMVSSGSIGAGLHRLHLKDCPPEIAGMQSAAAVGQVELMNAYRQVFAHRELVIGQLLLTRDGLMDRTRHLNARNTVNALLRAGAVPVVNENDTVRVEEIRFGDNDMLSALVADLVDADALILLSALPGLLDTHPGEGSARVIPEVHEIDTGIESLAWKGTSQGGTGGMPSKLAAIRAAAAVGIGTFLVDGRAPHVLERVLDGEMVGTFFAPTSERGAARKRWLQMHTVAAGALAVNEGAKRAILEQGRSLLAVGVVAVRGEFKAGDTVDITDEPGRPFARGIVNLSAEDMERVRGHQSASLPTILGRVTSDEIIHRDNMAVGPVPSGPEPDAP